MAGLKKEESNKVVLWFKRLGWTGVLFFTVKGIITTAIILGLGKVVKDFFGF